MGHTQTHPRLQDLCSHCRPLKRTPLVDSHHPPFADLLRLNLRRRQFGELQVGPDSDHSFLRPLHHPECACATTMVRCVTHHLHLNLQGDDSPTTLIANAVADASFRNQHCLFRHLYLRLAEQ